MELQIRENNNIYFIKVDGNIDFYDAPAFKNNVSDLVLNGSYDFIVDLEKVESIDSSGIGAILSIYNEIRKNNKVLVLLNVNDTVKRVFQLTNILNFFPIKESEKEALAFIEGRRFSN